MHKSYNNHTILLKVRFDKAELVEVLDFVVANLAKKHKFYIVTPNPEIVLAAQSDPELLRILNNADLSIPDGTGITLFKPSLKLVKGRELMVNLFALASKKKLKIYLLGSTDAVINKCIQKLKIENSKLEIAGRGGPMFDKNANPVSEIDTKLEIDIVGEINHFKPDLLFVGLGTPKEQKWIAKWLPKLNIGGAMEVGGSFDYFAGAVKPTPAVMSSISLEWLWRVIQEPKRVKRIFNALVLFPLAVLKSLK